MDVGESNIDHDDGWLAVGGCHMRSRVSSYPIPWDGEGWQRDEGPATSTEASPRTWQSRNWPRTESGRFAQEHVRHRQFATRARVKT